MAKTQILKRFTPGQIVTVTNHYITRIDHPCYGTRTRTIAKVTGSHLWFAGPNNLNNNVPWPKASDLRADGETVQFYGFPNAGDLFLTIQGVR